MMKVLGFEINKGDVQSNLHVNPSLTSTVQLFRPTGANVALPAPTASSTVL
jgi:hypothetical protein